MSNILSICYENKVISIARKGTKFWNTNAIDTDNLTSSELKKLIKTFLLNEKPTLDLCAWYPPHTLDKLISTFHYIEAAGGLIRNPKNQLLWIFRRGKWDLPKGKTEKNETLSQTAVREVMEECHLALPPTITKHLTDTYHFYQYKQKWAIKRTAWFLMDDPTNQHPNPQEEEDITIAAYFPESDIPSKLQNTFPTIQQVIAAYQNT